MAERGHGAKFWIEDKLARACLGAALALPYATRVRVMGWFVSRVVAPLAGYHTRVRDNLAHACPDLPEAEVRRLMRAVPDTVGRALIESYSGKDFIARCRDIPLEGPGAETVAKAHAEGRPVLLVTGHFGNYDAARAAFIGKGYRVGALYNPMKNAYFNKHYTEVMAAMGQGNPVFPRTRRGLAELVKHLRGGGMAAIVVDQYMHHGAMLDFFGKPAPTALSAAELALKHDAPCVPVYAIRQPNGLDFRVVVEAPIPPGDPAAMTQALNDSLEARVRAHMDQWFWIHRRWKPERHAARAAADSEA